MRKPNLNVEMSLSTCSGGINRGLITLNGIRPGQSDFLKQYQVGENHDCLFLTKQSAYYPVNYKTEVYSFIVRH